jgi:hypothetical protein
MDGEGLSGDARRLLMILGLYGSTPKGRRVWTKDFTLNAVVFQGIRAGLFDDYDLGLGMIHYLGNDYFAMCSHEAEGDLEKLFVRGIVQKVILNTQFYTPEVAWRLAAESFAMLDQPGFITTEDQAALRRLILCRHCKVRCCDYVGVSSADRLDSEESRGRRLYRVCSCYRSRLRYRDYSMRLLPQDEYLPGFFNVGDCEYSGRPLFVENINEW